MKYLVKLLITIGLLGLILSRIDLDATRTLILSVPPRLLLLALALQLASNVVAALRWRLIMDRIGHARPFSFYLGSYFKGWFFNQGLPTSIGGDGIRILDLTRTGSRAEEAFYGVFIDRITGLAGLLLLNLGALILNRSLLPRDLALVLALIVSGLLAGLLALFFLRKFRLFTSGRFLGYLGRLSERYFAVYSTPGSALVQLGLSLLTHLLAMTAFYILGRGTGLDFPLAVYLVLVPPVVLLTILPLSLAGWGIREGAMVGFFLLIGADRDRVVSFSLLYGLTAFAASLPGLAVFLKQKHSI